MGKGIRNGALVALAGASLFNGGCARSQAPRSQAPRGKRAETREATPAVERRPGWGLTNGRKPDLPAPFSTPSANNPPRVTEPPAGALPTVPAGYHIAVWTNAVQDPRHMALAPNGDVFVVESNRGRIRVFRGTGPDGKPKHDFTFATGLRQPFGISFYKDWLYVGDTDAVVRFRYKPGQTQAEGQPEEVTQLTPGGYNQHWTRNVLADPKRNKIYVSVGSRTNDDVEQPPRASILEMNPDGSGRRTFADGLRNPVGLAINPDTGRLWTAVNERDGLGDNVPPDYATEVKEGGFYGWPYAYIGPNEDPRHKGERQDLVAKAIVPDVMVGPHTAALNIAFNPGPMLPGRGDAFVALHGSWNRSRRDGYKVIRIPMSGGRPTGDPQDFVSGFVLDNDAVWGRPVGLLFLKDGSLLVSEDGNNVIYRVTYGGNR